MRTFQQSASCVLYYKTLEVRFASEMRILPTTKLIPKIKNLVSDSERNIQISFDILDTVLSYPRPAEC